MRLEKKKAEELKAAESLALRSSGSSSSVGAGVAILILIPDFGNVFLYDVFLQKCRRFQ